MKGFFVGYAILALLSFKETFNRGPPFHCPFGCLNIDNVVVPSKVI